MTQLVLISDTHGLHDQVRVPPCDILVHAGDCTNDAGQASLRDFLRWLERQPAPAKVLIAGNHDWAFEKWPDLARAMVKEVAPSVTYLQDSGVTIEGLRFWGSPYSPRFFDWAFNSDRGADIKRHWDMIPPDTDVLVTHGPPTVGMIDYTPHDRMHVGDQDLFEAIQRVKPRVSVHGHIHHGYGKAMIMHGDLSGTTCYNASVVNEAYRVVNAPTTINL